MLWKSVRFVFASKWILWGGLLLALGYVPSVSTNFDFVDDGNLVYPAPAGTTVTGHVDRWWCSVVANVEHLGPFRPVLWAHWLVAAEVCDGQPTAWRLLRLAWCGVAGAMLLWLLKLLKVVPQAACLSGAAAMWNPYRNEIWTSLTLAEGVAMPYAMLALVAARKAALSERGRGWDFLVVVCFVACLGCKNTFVALLPALMWLRVTHDRGSLRVNVRAAWPALLAYLLPLLMPLAHFIYFKLNWQPGQYETPGPSAEQLLRIASWLKGAAGLDFLGVGMLLTLMASVPKLRRNLLEHKALYGASVALLFSGIGVYSVTEIMAARYTMPAVWGVDLLFALGLTTVWQRPSGSLRSMTLSAVIVGMVAMFAANLGRQEKLAARSQVLWDTLHHVERHAPHGATIDWMSGPVSAGMFDEEEGIHFAWHLQRRGRDDLHVRLVGEKQQTIQRVELVEATGPSQFAIRMKPNADGEGKVFAVRYRFGKKQFCASLERIEPKSPDTNLLNDLLPRSTTDSLRTTAEARPK